MGVAMGPAMCGIFFCLLRQERGQPVKFDHLMRGIDYFLQRFHLNADHDGLISW